MYFDSEKQKHKSELESYRQEWENILSGEV